MKRIWRASDLEGFGRIIRCFGGIREDLVGFRGLYRASEGIRGLQRPLESFKGLKRFSQKLTPLLLLKYYTENFKGIVLKTPLILNVNCARGNYNG